MHTELVGDGLSEDTGAVNIYTRGSAEDSKVRDTYTRGTDEDTQGIDREEDLDSIITSNINRFYNLIGDG